VRIFGVDPGLRFTGYACVDADPDQPHVSPTLVEAGVFRLPAGRTIADRLVELDADLTEVLARLRPGVAGVESLFSHYKRPTTAVAMGHARGVILLAIRRTGARIIELKPTRVKKSLTGFGHASKDQMQEAVRAQLNLRERPEPADVADAIAVALCVARTWEGAGVESPGAHTLGPL